MELMDSILDAKRADAEADISGLELEADAKVTVLYGLGQSTGGD
jgi:hypothetical protein